MATIKDVMIAYLKSYREVSTVDIETILPKYGQLMFGVLHTPSTYSRCFRELREKMELRKYGLIVKEISNNSSRVKKWQINSL